MPHFSGCIDELYVSGRLINLNSEKDVSEARGIESGCADFRVRTASSIGSGKGMIEIQYVSLSRTQFCSRSSDLHIVISAIGHTSIVALQDRGEERCALHCAATSG